MPHFLTIIIFTFIHTIQSYIFSSFIICRGPSSCIFIAAPAGEEPPWGPEPRIELGPAWQQADELPTKLLIRIEQWGQFP
jgi:hypothetical protein